MTNDGDENDEMTSCASSVDEEHDTEPEKPTSTSLFSILKSIWSRDVAWRALDKRAKRKVVCAAITALCLIFSLALFAVTPVFVILILVVAVFYGLSAYTVVRFVVKVRRNAKPMTSNEKVIVGVVIALLWIILVSAALLGQSTAMISEERSSTVIFLWTLALIWGHALLFMAILDLLHLVAWLGVCVAGKVDRLWPEPHRIGRVKAAAALFAGVVTSLVGLTLAMSKPEIVHYDVHLARFPASMDGFRIAVLTDLHASATVSREQFEVAVQLALEQKPDVIALVGDLMDGPLDKLAPTVSALAACNAAPSGCFWVSGNHLFLSPQPARWTRFINDTLGIRALRNERVRIYNNGTQDFFYLAGVDDWSAESAGLPGFGARPDLALGGVEDDRETVFLAHQPKHVVAARQYDAGLHISGHNHRGQVAPQHLLVMMTQPLFFGLYDFNAHGERTQAIVTAGTYYWGPPMRTLSRNEVVVVDLFREP
eukprot:TRINITY_DN325_c0_g1_i2.p1 TRINITY_DN325_c0_g1~~TRINITY_DN325_c0_g1_i2.p1  ORF type:complete len:484 (-),score=148.01 TRINITY_DN325_c0_g1_i2:32-1483(-)